MITNKFVLFICSLKPRLLEKHRVNGRYWELKVFWFGKTRLLKFEDKPYKY
jgi:hypothetical protein